MPVLVLASALLLAGMATILMTRPRPAVGDMLARAEQMIAQSEPERALAVLNNDLRPHLDEAFVTGEQRARFHAARARAIAAGIRHLDLDDPANHESVIEEFAKAERLGHSPTDADLVELAGSMLDLGRVDEAREPLSAMGPEAGAERIALTKRIIVTALGELSRESLADELLLELEEAADLSDDDRVWVAARRTERRLAQGFTDEAIARLLRLLPRIGPARPEARGELFLLLGRAYAQAGAVPDARKQFDRAVELIEPGDELYPTAMLERGRVLEQSGEPEAAREHFETVVQSYASSEAFLPALLSLGEVLSLLAESDATLATEDDAVEAYARFVEEARRRGIGEDLRARAVSSMLTRFDEQLVRGVLVRAAQYAQIAEDLTGADGSAPEVILAQAIANRRQAEQLLSDVSGGDEAPDLSRLDPSTRAQAQRWFVRSGDYYRRHADRLAGGDDDLAYAESLWNAATMFDGGGDTAEAIAAYIEFAGTISDDPRVPAAQYKLGRAYQASGEYGLAAQQYESLLEIALDPERGTGVGPYAVQSYVPLAETYLYDADPGNDARASELLEAVLRGDAGDVEGEAFGAALAAMGVVHYHAGRYPRAIELLEEAAAREPDGRRLGRVKYMLADTYRLESGAISATLGGGAVAPSEERQLVATRESHLVRAIELFAQAREAGEQIPEVRRTPLESVQLRNSYFYLGDCAFDLGHFDEAIRYYSVAKDRYADDAASLVALVQIFNAYLELGELAKARTASERARRFYEGLPETAWDDPTLPMSRGDWERWLDSSFELASMRSAGVAE